MKPGHIAWNRWGNPGDPRCFFGKLIGSFFPALQGNLIENICLLFDIFSPESLRYILSGYMTI